MVTGMRTTYDGGKTMSGFGMFTGTSTAAWVLMTFGTKNCTGTTGPTEPTGYATMATYGGTTTVLCASKASWIWSPPTLATSEQTSTIVLDVGESWPTGTALATHTVPGSAPILFAVGGINSGRSFGLGIWNMIVYGIDLLDGADMTSVKYVSTGSGTTHWNAMANDSAVNTMNGTPSSKVAAA